jgi:hypothetical protein
MIVSFMVSKIRGVVFSQMPYQPDYTGGMDYTNPPYSPDVFGGGNGGNFNSFNPANFNEDPYFQNSPFFQGVVGMEGQPMGGPAQPQQQQPPPTSTLPPPQTPVAPVQQQGAAPAAQASASTLPWFQQQLESATGPYANRQVGDYAPSTAPLNVQNPQTLKDWQDRYYWFEQHQNYLTNPTAPRTQSATNPDYTMPWTVPGGSFAKNVYADSNAQQSFLELQGVLTPERLQEAQQKYGWQQAVPSVSPDQQSVYKTAIQMANADPNSDYSIVQTVGGYGILKRENGGGNVAAMQAAQSARGFISPAVAIARAQAEAQARQQSQVQSNRGGGGNARSFGGNGGGSQQRTVSDLPSPTSFKGQNIDPGTGKPYPPTGSLGLAGLGGSGTVHDPNTGRPHQAYPVIPDGTRAVDAATGRYKVMRNGVWVFEDERGTVGGRGPVNMPN